jgi:thiol:disulfide interchange protein
MRPILLATLFSSMLYAAPFQWIVDYDSALTKAKKVHRPLMLFLSKPQCKTCRFMKEQVFTDREVQAYLQAHYVAAKFEVGNRTLPDQYCMPMSPVFTFIDPEAGEIVEQIIGGRKPTAFLHTLQNVLDENPQFR